MEIRYIHFDTLGSTNTWAKAHAGEFDPEEFTCITAEEQTAGRGRFNRRWISPRGENIYASLFFTLPKSFPSASNLGQIMAYSCALVLREKKFDAKIKWPNDLLIGGKKVAGILAELVDLGDRLGAVLGIGINVDMKESLLQTIDQPATSLSQLSPKIWKAEQLLEPLMQRFLRDLKVLEEKGFAAFHPAYNQLLAYRGKEISCHDGTALRHGVCQGIAPDGALELRLSSGELLAIHAGDVKFS